MNIDSAMQFHVLYQGGKIRVGSQKLALRRGVDRGENRMPSVADDPRKHMARERTGEYDPYLLIP